MTLNATGIVSVNEEVIKIVKLVEGFHSFIYLDGRWVPTIGYGIALVINNGSAITPNWVAFDAAELNVIFDGVAVLDVQERQRLNDAASALNRTPGAVNPFSSQPVNGSIAITSADGEQMLNNILPGSIASLDSLLGDDDAGVNIWSWLNNTKEGAAILSLWYNGERGVIPKDGGLHTALKEKDRLSAWFEIRYASNGGGSANGGLQKRRYYESELFGLYDSGKTTEQHATEIYNFLYAPAKYPDIANGITRNIDTIITKEALFSKESYNAIRDYGLTGTDAQLTYGRIFAPIANQLLELHWLDKIEHANSAPQCSERPCLL